MRPQSKKIGTTLKTIRGKKGKWEVFTYKVKGRTLFGNRLISRNGWIATINLDFQTLYHAIRNINTIQKLS